MPISREEVVWAASFAKHYDVSAEASFVQSENQSRDEFKSAVDAFRDRQSFLAARCADAAVMASMGVDAISLGEGIF